jgi:hypothetical protein
VPLTREISRTEAKAELETTQTHTHDAIDQLETIDVQAECACSVLQAVFTGHA